jgi:uncharacterized protein YsxB (DUF464 family)
MSNKIYKIIFNAKSNELEVLFEDDKEISEKDKNKVFSNIKLIREKIREVISKYNESIDLVEN